MNFYKLILLVLLCMPLKSTCQGGWYGWWADLSASEGNFWKTPEVLYVFPETDVSLVRYDSSWTGFLKEDVQWCSVGQGFDANSEHWQKTPAPSRFREYSVDSVFVRYVYFRQNPDPYVVDTLVIQVYSNLSKGLVTGKLPNNAGEFAVPTLDRKTGRGSGFLQEIKIPLTEDDSCLLDSSGYFHTKTIAAGFNEGRGVKVEPGGFLHTTMSFIPGQPYSSGDTLLVKPSAYGNGAQLPKNPMNALGVVASIQWPFTQLESFNNASFVTAENRYLDPQETPEELQGRYWPNPIDLDSRKVAYYPQIGFYISQYYMSVGEQRLSEISVYPNPAVDRVTLDWSHEFGNEAVDVIVTNACGQVVFSGSFRENHNQVTLRTDKWPAGLCHVQVISRDGTAAIKLFVKR